MENIKFKTLKVENERLENCIRWASAQLDFADECMEEGDAIAALRFELGARDILQAGLDGESNFSAARREGYLRRFAENRERMEELFRKAMREATF